MKTFTAHLLQWSVKTGRVEENLLRAEDLLARSAPAVGDLVVLPEMFSCGFDYPGLGQHAAASAEITGWMSGMATRYQVALAGSLPEMRADGVANSLVVVDQAGKRSGSYDKVQLFPVTGEDRYFLPGGRLRLIHWRGIEVGLLVCFDLRYPELARSLCLAGATLLVVCAQWPLSRVDNFRDLVKVRAMENQLFAVAVNACGRDHSETMMGGHSLVADPRGRVCGELGEDEGILAVPVDPVLVEEVRAKFPVLSWRRGDLPVHEGSD